MSRYVDLDGKTWDGTPISSKIQEVKTKSGYMQGITVGWLWGDNVPKLDLEEHDKQIYNQALEDMANKIKEYSGEHYLDCDGYGCQTELVFRTEDFLDDVLSELKK